MSVDGDLLWLNQNSNMNTTTDNQKPRICTDSYKNIYLIYQTRSFGSLPTTTSTAIDNVIVIKYDENGNQLWEIQQTINTSGSCLEPAITMDPNDNLYIAYVTLGTVAGGTRTGGSWEVVSARINIVNGSLIWIKQYAEMNSTSVNDYVRISSNSTGVYLTYQSNGAIPGGEWLGDYDVVVSKINLSGTFAWAKQLSALNTILLEDNQNICCNEQNLYITYMTTSAIPENVSNGNTDIVVAKFELDGTLIWAKQIALFNTPFTDSWPDIACDKYNNIYVTFVTYDGGLYYGVKVVKMDTNGIEIFSVDNMNVTDSNKNAVYPSISVSREGYFLGSYNTYNDIQGATHTATFTDAVVYYYDNNGNMLWIKQNSGFNASVNNIRTVTAVDIHDNAIITYIADGFVSGYTSTGNTDIVVFKLKGTLFIQDSISIIKTSNSNSNSVKDDIIFEIIDTNLIELPNMVKFKNYLANTTYDKVEILDTIIINSDSIKYIIRVSKK
jgi:hypothetical protein